jgi:hypothetical protein
MSAQAAEIASHPMHNIVMPPTKPPTDNGTLAGTSNVQGSGERISAG